MANPTAKHEIPAVELLEEALHLLRQAPAALAYYAVGTVPFVLGLLFFWADMSRSAYAASRCAAASLGLALGFIWMKTWQAAFAVALRRRLGGGQGARRGLRGWLGVAAAQTIIQPWGLALFLPALLVTLPFPWFYAFCQNVTATGRDEREGVAATVRRAWTQAALWPTQNVMVLLCLSFFAFLVFLNVVMALLAIPFLIKTFLGIQLSLVQSPWAVFNSTFFAAAAALTYLCVDPLAKAAYVLRCFYGESLKTGEALQADLARLKRVGGMAAATLAVLAVVGGNALCQMSNVQYPMVMAVAGAKASDYPAGTAERFDVLSRGLAAVSRPTHGPAGKLLRTAPAVRQDPGGWTDFRALAVDRGKGDRHPANVSAAPRASGAETARARAELEAQPNPAVSPARLDRSIQQTLRSPRYAWRMPRQLKTREDKENQSVLALFIDATLKRAWGWLESFGNWLGRVFKKLFSSSSSPSRPKPKTSTGFGDAFIAFANAFLYVPLAIVLVTLGIFLWRLWLRRKSLLPTEEADDTLLAALPDLNDEKTAADQLPTDGWLLLAQQMIDRGDYRLAMRALYLASLAALAQAGLVRIRRSKSNLDYARELQRRAHAWPGLLDIFRANVAVFDRSWYGLHEVTPEGIEDFKSNYERIRSLVG